MHDDVFVYLVPMPENVHESVLPCLEGFTVYIDESLPPEERIKKYEHAINHIEKRHHAEHDIQKIETENHK